MVSVSRTSCFTGTVMLRVSVRVRIKAAAADSSPARMIARAEESRADAAWAATSLFTADIV